ncbi:hypothetical protein V8E36_003954 [Tilletia maclaganii]
MNTRVARSLLSAGSALRPTARVPAPRAAAAHRPAQLGRLPPPRSSWGPSNAYSTAGNPPPTRSSRWISALTGSAFALGVIVTYASSSRQVLHQDAAPLPGARVGFIPATRKDPATGTELPETLPLPLSLGSSSGSGAGPLGLIGLGVRTVSFLSVRVYVAGVYADLAALERSKGDLRGLESAEAIVQALLDAGVPFVVRIVPVRSTDFNHLRDGFTRSVQARLKAARKAQKLTPEADEQLALSLQSLKSLFPPSKLPKGESLDLVVHRQSPGSSSSSQSGGDGKARMALSLEHKSTILGTLEAPAPGTEAAQGGWSVARELVLAYVADKNEISTPLKTSVTEGLRQHLQS